jgi:ankyrin repeat protein
MLASDHGDVACVKLLVAAGADLNLQQAVSRGCILYGQKPPFCVDFHHIIVRVLCEQDGWTALMFVSNKNHVELVKLLTDAGADPEARTVVSYLIMQYFGT